MNYNQITVGIVTFKSENVIFNCLKSIKKIKNIINLDTNIQIKLDFINSHSADKFVEKGWDEEKQMYYYLVYFNKEHKA